MPAPEGSTPVPADPVSKPPAEAAATPADVPDKPDARRDGKSDAEPTSSTEADGGQPEANVSAPPATPPPSSPEVLAGKTPTSGGEEGEAVAPPTAIAPSADTREGAAESGSGAADLRDAPMTPDEQAAFVPEVPAKPMTKPSPEPAPKAAKTLYAKSILADPRVRGALGKLPPQDRIVQICGIEAREQARHSSASFRPDLLKGFGKNGGLITGPHLRARGGAVRSQGVWREITFDCTVNAAFDTITAFRFAVGAIIPQSDWAARGLVAN
jgi:hypothetical protein